MLPRIRIPADAPREEDADDLVRALEAGVNTLVKSLLTPGAAPRLNEVNLQLTGAAAVAERLYAITEAMKKRPTLWYV